MKRPICPNCNKPVSPSGGMLDGSESFWTCWDCGYRIDDIQVEIIEPKKLK